MDTTSRANGASIYTTQLHRDGYWKTGKNGNPEFLGLRRGAAKTELRTKLSPFEAKAARGHKKKFIADMAVKYADDPVKLARVKTLKARESSVLTGEKVRKLYQYIQTGEKPTSKQAGRIKKAAQKDPEGFSPILHDMQLTNVKPKRIDEITALFSDMGIKISRRTAAEIHLLKHHINYRWGNFSDVELLHITAKAGTPGQVLDILRECYKCGLTPDLEIAHSAGNIDEFMDDCLQVAAQTSPGDLANGFISTLQLPANSTKRSYRLGSDLRYQRHINVDEGKGIDDSRLLSFMFVDALRERYQREVDAEKTSPPSVDTSGGKGPKDPYTRTAQQKLAALPQYRFVSDAPKATKFEFRRLLWNAETGDDLRELPPHLDEYVREGLALCHTEPRAAVARAFEFTKAHDKFLEKTSKERAKIAVVREAQAKNTTDLPKGGEKTPDLGLIDGVSTERGDAAMAEDYEDLPIGDDIFRPTVRLSKRKSFSEQDDSSSLETPRTTKLTSLSSPEVRARQNSNEHFFELIGEKAPEKPRRGSDSPKLTRIGHSEKETKKPSAPKIRIPKLPTFMGGNKGKRV